MRAASLPIFPRPCADYSRVFKQRSAPVEDGESGQVPGAATKIAQKSVFQRPV
jgi:hypothetical protein